jgi:hypothetical protein
VNLGLFNADPGVSYALRFDNATVDLH